MTIDREAWLAKSPEKVLEPHLEIIDAHHHMWDRPGNRYMPQELLRDIDGNNVVKTVFIDCRSGYRADGPEEMKPLGETEFMESIAARSAAGEFGRTFIAAAIIGHANLILGAAAGKVLDGHMAVNKGHFRGIRHSTVWDASPAIDAYMRSPKGLMLDATFRQGFACLRKHNLVFDAWVFFHQLTELADLAKAFPDTTIIVNHIGGPIHVGPYAGRTDEVMHEWRHGITAMAGCPNAVMKLGGIGMTRTGFGWHERPAPPGSTELAEAMAPYYLFCIEKFGPGRCMFESNFPVDKASHGYTPMWNAFKILTRDFTPGERRDMFYGTASRVYRI